MQCPRCRQENPADARYCGGCGERLARTCPSCGHANAPETRFCNACGHGLDVSTGGARSEELARLATKQAVAGAARPALVYPAERRQLTVLFCDLVGSTALSTRLDPEELRSMMQAYQQACRNAIERYEGQVAQFLGDGVMAYFGWPQAHEDDAERAVRAALDIVAGLEHIETPTPLHVHTGIASGSVVVGESASADAAEPRLAVGETPNLAARLQGLAGTDDVVIASSTHKLVGSVFVCEDMGEHTLKGIVEPVRAWRVQGLGAAEGRFEATRAAQLSPLVGREDELGLLQGRWKRAQEGEGQVVLLCGEPGIGKSRITQALLERIAGEPHLRLRYQCSPHHTQSAFHPIIEHLHRAGRLSIEDTAEVKLAKIEALMAAAQAEDPRAVPLIAALFDLPTTDQYPPLNYSPQKQKDETVRALSRQLIALSREAPVLLLLEDAHWIDPSSVEAFDHLVQLAQGYRILALITFRPEFPSRWTEQSHVTLLTLNRLSNRQTAELVKRVAGAKPLPEEVLEQIAAKTDGVPLFVEELTKSVLESGLLKEDADRYHVAALLPALAIPTTLRDSLMARLDRLAPVKEIAQVGACIGREFGYQLLGFVAPAQGSKLDKALEQLVGSGLVFQRGSPPEASYIFKHALVQDAAYESLLKAKRAQIHARIGEALEGHFPAIAATQPEIVAQHYTAAEMHEKAIPYWQRAGELAHRRMALQESIAHLERGIGLVERLKSGAGRDRLELDLRAALGMAWIALRGWAYPDVERNLARAWELEQRLLFYEQVLAPLCRALLLLQLDRAGEAEAAFRLGIPRWCEAGMGSSLPLWTTWHAQTAGLLDHLDQGLALVEEALEQIHRPGWEERISLSETLRIKGWLLQRLGDLDQAEACFRDAIGVSRQQQAKSWELRAASSYAQLLKDQGRRAEALDLLQPVYDWFTEGRSTKDHIEAKALIDELRA